MHGLNEWFVSRSVDGVCRNVSSAAMGCSSNVTVQQFEAWFNACPVDFPAGFDLVDGIV